MVLHDHLFMGFSLDEGLCGRGGNLPRVNLNGFWVEGAMSQVVFFHVLEATDHLLEEDSGGGFVEEAFGEEEIF